MTADLQPGRLVRAQKVGSSANKAGRCAKSTRHAKQPSNRASNLRGRSAGAVAHHCIA